ncbi:MAG: polyprenyl synthetase family protein [Chloroflexota bacterium]
MTTSVSLTVPSLTLTTQRAEKVLALAERFALEHAGNQRQQEMMRIALAGLHAQVRSAELQPFVSLPLLVHAAVRGDDTPALPLAVATTLLFLGIDIHDDLADGDLPDHWNGCRTAEISLVAATLLCALPQLVLSELDLPPSHRDAMQRTVAQGLLRMSGGQHMDLAHAGASWVSARAVEASVRAKSGEEAALFAVLAAQAAGASPGLTAVYERLGGAIGTAGQLASDCADLFRSEHSKDLDSGARTLPIALHLERLDEPERERFLDLLREARTERAAQERIRQRLLEAGELRRCAVTVELYCQRARRALQETRALEPGRSGLGGMIDRISFFSSGCGQ